MKTKNHFTIVALFMVCVQFCSAATLYSRTNGTWSSAGTWSYTDGGPLCGCSPASADIVIVSHAIQMDKNLTGGSASVSGALVINPGGSMNGNNNFDIDFKSGSKLDNSGTLNARHVSFYNSSIIFVATGGVLNVTGNLDNRNNSDNITINGIMNVTGSFSNGNGGLINGSGTISVQNGPVINTGSTFAYVGLNPCAVFPCMIVGKNPLPVEWLSVKAKQQQTSVRISWSTASESNNDFFTVEKSTAPGNFVVLGTVRGAGNATQQKDYNYTDNQVSKGTIYYRVGQTDYDGKQSFSDVISLTTVPVKNVVLSPNPLTTNRVKLESDLLNDGEVSVKIFDNKGKEVKFEIFPSLVHGEMFIQFDRDQITAGSIYHVNILSGNQVSQEKLLIQ